MTGLDFAAAAVNVSVETAGAYAGLAAIIGLGVLSLLYFSQAREVRRLREWAGRAPERALELEQRVQADAQRRVVAQPLAPATIAAQNDAARQAAAAAELYAKLPPPPPAPAPLVGPPGQLARPGAPATPAAGVTNPPPAGAPTAPATSSTATPAPAATPPPDSPAAPAAPGAIPAAPAADSAGATSAPSPAPTTAAATAAAAARQAMASHAASSSATTNGAGQETRESEAARPSPPPVPPPHLPEATSEDSDDGGFSATRIGVIVGGAIVVVLTAVVLMATLTGKDPAPKPNDFGTSTPAAFPDVTSPGTSSTPSGTGTTARVDRRAVKVAVLNGTTQTGLARGVADKLEQSGFTIGAVGNNADQQVPQTIVSYTAGNERAAFTVAGLIKVDRGSVQSIDTNTSVAADADVVVTVGNDQIG